MLHTASSCCNIIPPPPSPLPSPSISLPSPLTSPFRCSPRVANPQGPLRSSGVRCIVWHHRRHDGVHLTERTAPNRLQIREEYQLHRTVVSDLWNGYHGSQSRAVSVLTLFVLTLFVNIIKFCMSYIRNSSCHDCRPLLLIL